MSFELVKFANKQGCLCLLAQTFSELRIYEVNLYASTNCVKLLSSAKHPLKIVPISLYQKDLFFPESFRKECEDFQTDLIFSLQNELYDAAIVVYEDSISYYFNG